MRGHLTHIEDAVYLDGTQGVQYTLSGLGRVINAASGRSSGVGISVKWDGAPAVILGNDPEDGRFFVAKKSIFNKNPVYYKSEQEILQDLDGDLALKMRILFRECSQMKFNTILQGELLYTRRDLWSQDGFLYFQPNTITYGIPADSSTGEKIAQSNVGIAFHTHYEGSIGNLMAQVGVPDNAFSESPRVWAFNTNLEMGGRVIDRSDMARLTAQLERARVNVHPILTFIDEEVVPNSDLFMRFMNAEVRQMNFPSVESFSTYVQKQPTTRITPEWITEHSKELIKLFRYIKHVSTIKTECINRLNTIQSEVKHFINNKEVGPEGYVISMGNSLYKLVNRYEFSHANFDDSIQKGWKKNEKFPRIY